MNPKVGTSSWRSPPRRPVAHAPSAVEIRAATDRGAYHEVVKMAQAQRPRGGRGEGPVRPAHAQGGRAAARRLATGGLAGEQVNGHGMELEHLPRFHEARARPDNPLPKPAHVTRV